MKVLYLDSVPSEGDIHTIFYKNSGEKISISTAKGLRGVVKYFNSKLSKLDICNKCLKKVSK